MAQTIKEQVLSILPKLSRADLEAIHLMAGHLLGGLGGAIVWPAEGRGTRAGEPVFEALASALGVPISYSSFNLTSSAKLFEKKLPSLLEFLNVNFAGWDEKKISQQAFLRMLFSLLINDLKEREVTPSLGILISNLGRIPEVFDNSFPLYREAGLGKVILKKFQ